MSKKSFAVRLQERLREFRSNCSGNVAVIFVITLIPLVSAVGVGVDTTRAMSVRAAVQAGLDSTALNMMRQASSLSNSNLSSTATSMFLANFNRPEASNIQISASYNSGTKSLSLTGRADVATEFMTVVGLSKFTVNTASTAQLGGSKRYSICVLIADPDSNHTFLVKNQATVNFNNCLVQVNTANWDAVEARDTAYIHSASGVNCFVGDIHYGDVLPAKEPTCDLLPDPFASYNVPVNACTHTNLTVNSPTSLSPGTYCGGIKISADTTFSPGIYYIQDGDLQILGSANVTANGVTFLLSGSTSNLNFTTSGTITMSPDLDASAGQWAGFQFYYDQPSATNNKKAGKAGKSTISQTTMTMSGIMYLVGQTLNITNNANVTVNAGAIASDFLLPDGANLTLSPLTSSNPAIFRKSIAGTVPTLVQ